MGLQNGEYERSHARDEKLRNDDEDVLYPQDESRFRAQVPSTRPGSSPILDRVLYEISEICPAATRMVVSHETLSVAIMIVSIVQIFVLAVSTGRRLLIGITTFDREQLFALLR